MSTMPPSQQIKTAHEVAIESIVNHQSLQDEEAVRNRLEKTLKTFVNEGDNKNKVPATADGILSAFKQSEEFSKLPPDSQTMIKGLADQIKLQAQTPANGAASNEASDPGEAGPSKKPAQEDGAATKSKTEQEALKQKAIDEAAARQLAASQGQQQQQPQVLTLGAVLAAALTGRLQRANAGPGQSAQAFAEGSMQQSDPSELMNQKIEKFKAAAAEVTGINGDVDSVKAKRALVDYGNSFDEVKQAFGDERRSIMAKIASGELREDAAIELLEKRSKDLSETHEAVAGSEVGKKNDQMMKNSEEQLKKLQESIKSLMDSIKKGLESMLSAFSKPSSQNGPAPGKVGMQ